MYYVYVLKSQNSDWLYIGYTNNLKRRLQQHMDDRNITSSRLGTKKLIYYEAYYSSKDARNRERQLKQYGAALGHLKKRINNSLKSAGCFVTIR